MILTQPLQSHELELRSLLKLENVEQYRLWLADPVINQFLETRHTTWDNSAIQQFVDEMNQSANQLLLGIFVQNQHIGNIKLGPIDTRHRLAYLSLFIGESKYWGKGYASRAIQLLSQHAFNAYGLEKLCASMYAENEGSLRAFLKAGYDLEGIFKNHYMQSDEKRTDLLQVGLSRETS